MQTKPILFNGEMVRAILDGRKTQTRRVIKNRSNCPDFYAYEPSFSYPYCFRRADARWDSFKTIEELTAKYCPLGQIGDRLWVRETWAISPYHPATYDGPAYFYRADYQPMSDVAIKWKPSIHMPREVSRLTLEVVDVRVERIQDISEKDAIAEGIEAIGHGWKNYKKPNSPPWCTPTYSFKSLWDSVYKTWEQNQWVWAIKFKRVEE